MLTAKTTRKPGSCRGQALVEYTLILVLASIGVLGIMDIFGVWLPDALNQINDAV